MTSEYKVLLVPLAVALFTNICYSHDTKSKVARVKNVGFCEIVKNPNLYNKQTIRTTAIYAVGHETSELYQSACVDADFSTWAKFSSSYTKPTGQLGKKLTTLLQSNNRVQVVIVGQFHGPRQVEVPKNVPPKLTEQMRYTNSRYGHLNAYRFLFTIDSIERVEQVEKSVLWPLWHEKN